MRLPVVGELSSGAWEALLSACGPCLSGEDKLLELDLSSVEWSPPSGLVSLASMLNYVRSKGVEVVVVNYPPEDTCSYYCRMDFFKCIGAETPCQTNRRSGAGRFIEISKLDDSELHDDITERLAALLESAPEASEISKQSFIDACGELVSNTRHAYDTGVDPEVIRRPAALIQAQYYPNVQQVEFCVCDSGVGIKASMEATDGNGFASHIDAIEGALARGNRNTNQEGAGLGLAALTSYVRQNGGSFAIRSGDALKKRNRDRMTGTEKLAYWPGTIITLRLKVDSETDLSKSWERMAQ
jgi:hypothetical protein